MNDSCNNFVPLSLDAHFNLDAVSTREAPDPGKMDGQFSLPVEGLPEKQTAWIEKIPFDLSLAEPGRKNCLVPNGHRISVAPGDYGAVYFLGTSVTGSSAAEVIFTFEAGGRRRELVERLRFTDWSHPAQFGEQQAISFPFRWGECGEILWPCALWLQAIVLPQTAGRLVSIALDHCPAMRIFAMTLGSGTAVLPDESMLEYLLARLGPKDSEAARFDTLYHALNDLQGLKNDERLKTDLAEIRGRVLTQIGFDALFSERDKQVIDCFRKCNKLLDERHASETARLAGQEPASPLDITLVGHSHLDAVWLWPRNVSVRKAFNTFSRNLKRLEKFHDVIFAQSSPQFYAWMEADYPDLFKAIQQQVKAGRWELVGGMWIEPDGNMPSGEALVRQRVFGQRYFLEKFGRLSEVAWIPDTFGMHKNHPQIIAKTGGRYFYTTKLMWNYENRFPYQHFIWESPDGSQVLALQSAVGCGEQPGPHQDLEASVKKQNMLLAPGQEARVDYSAPYPPEDALSQEFIPEVLAIYGEGDGGEGPSDRCYHRAENLAYLPNYWKRHGAQPF